MFDRLFLTIFNVYLNTCIFVLIVCNVKVYLISIHFSPSDALSYDVHNNIFTSDGTNCSIRKSNSKFEILIRIELSS